MKLTNFYFAFLLCIASIGLANAQQLPNYNFASAGGTFNGTTQPASWTGSNVNQSGFSFTFVEYRTGEGRDGSNAVYIANKEVGALGITANAPGYLSLGTPFSYVGSVFSVNSTSTAGTEGGIDFTFRPDTMSVWLKRTMGGSTEALHLVAYSWKGTSIGTTYLAKDGSSCVSTTRTDEESDIRQLTDKNVCNTSQYATQIAEAEYTTTDSWSEWRQVKVPITYYNSEVPEKFNVIISAGNYPNGRQNKNNNPGNSILLDEVTLIYSSKIHELRFNGTPYASFDANTETYTYEIEKGGSIPTITAYRSGRQLSGSEISISYGDIGTTPTTVTVTAEDGSSTTTYTINFVYVRDTNCTLEGLTVNGESVSGFSSKVTSYSVSLPYGTTEFPEIGYTKGADTQTVEIVECELPGTAQVVVTAENPDYVTTYNITFSIAKLSDTTLSDILINGNSISGFSSTKLSYTVEIPIGTTDDPTITPVSAYEEGEQTIVVDNQGLSGTSTITVSAPGATNSRTYKISYKITSSTNSNLQNIFVGGEAIADFSPTTYEYTVNLGPDVTEAPAITWTSGDDYQTITLEEGGLDATSRIKVVAQDGVSISIYKITLTVNKSTVNTLSAIYLDGELLSGFSPSVTSYSVSLPIGTTTLPEITWEQGDAYQTVAATYGGVNGDTKIVVTSQSGSKKQYTITFSVTKADVSTLKSILLDGVEIEGFSPETTAYTVALPIGTTQAPAITYVANDEYQTITIDEGGLSGTTRIVVRSQAGTSTTYTINFTVEQSSNAYLNNIYVGGVALDGFAAETYSYDYELPSGTISLPDITVEKGDDYQTVAITKGGVNGTTTIKVTAQDGTVATYSITFSVKKSENAYLKGISVAGVALQDFVETTFAYTYTLTTETSCPVISVTKADESQTVQISAPSLVGVATITVTPEEGDANVYTITFAYEQSSDASLAGISIGGTALTGFSSDVYEYTYQLPVGTVSLPQIEVSKNDENQTVELITNGVSGTTTIRVVAEDGSEAVYSITFSVAQSSNALLTAINVGDDVITMQDGVFAYEYEISKSVTTQPAIVPVKADENATYSMSLPAMEGTVSITVVSEDRTNSQTYTLEIKYAQDSDVKLSGIKVGETELTLQDDVYEYSLSLPYGYSTQSVEVTKYSESQNVVIVNERSVIYIYVRAESGATATYTINITELVSSEVYLKDLQVYDIVTKEYVSIDGFVNTTFDYKYQLAENTTVVPAINPVPADDKQTIQVNYASVDDTTFIYVTAADGASSTYSVLFNATKSADATLSAIYLDGEELSGFDSEVTTYNVTLSYESYTSAVVPKITAEKGDEGSTLYILTAPIGETSYITVTSEDGSATRTYFLNFSVDYSSLTNVLSQIQLDGEGLAGFESSTFDYTVELPYGTTAAPVVTYTKSFDEQTVLVSNNGLSGTSLTVKSNVGAADVTYNISYNFAVSPAALGSITVDGNQIDGFAQDKYKYIYTVTSGGSTPTVQFIDQSGNPISKTVDNVNYAEATNTSGDYSETYAVYFHYADDVIPNSDFSSWSSAKYNNSRNGASKPTSWTCPADCAEKYKVTTTYYTGYEVVNDNGSLMLQTYYKVNMWTGEGNNYSISGAVPGMITTGDMTVNLASSGGTSSSVSGGITFRNTPDYVSVDYNPTSCTRVNNWRMLVSHYDANGTQTDDLYEGSYGTMNQWQNASLNITYSDTDRSAGVNKFNFTLNASHSETGLGSYTALNPIRSTLYVDNLTDSYSSAVSAVSVNGVAASLSGSTYSVTIDDVNYVGLPVVSVTGAVPDQSYSIDYGTEVVDGDNYVRTMTLTSYAEDLSTSEYSIVVTRPVNKYLKDIKIDGVSLSDFAQGNTSYTYTKPVGQDYMPDVEAVAYDNSQTITYNVVDNQCQITVKAGNSSITYIVTMVASQSDVSTLNMIYVDGSELSGFSSDVTEYTIDLPAGTSAIPDVTFDKSYRQAAVGYTEAVLGGTSTLNVTSEDGNNNTIYSITFNVLPSTETTKQLAGLSIYDIPATKTQLAFDKDVYEYSFERDYAVKYYSYYERAYADDSLIVVLTDSKITYTLINANSAVVAENRVYVLNFADAASTDNTLADIKVNGTSLESFDKTVLDYSLSIERGASLVVEPVANTTVQLIESTYDADAAKYSFSVWATQSSKDNGDAANVYTLSVSEIKSSVATLSKLTIGDSEIALIDGTFEYEFEFPVGTYLLPDVSAIASDYGASIAIELPQSVSGNVVITVTSEDGNTINIYTVKLSVAKSDNANLSMIFADHVELADFDSNVYQYEYVIESGKTTPVITYQKAETAQTVEEVTTDNGLDLVVTAENGNTNTYSITYTVNYSSVSALSYIKLDGELIDGFTAETYEYTISLPVGTTTLPEISYAAAGNYQTITVTDGGVNGDYVISSVAEDGVSTSVYTIHFSVILSDVDYLSMIYLDGEQLLTTASTFTVDADFASDVYEYNVKLPVGSTALPSVTADKGDVYQQEVAISIDSENNVVSLTSTSESGLTKNYTLNFEFLKSEVDTLSALYVNGEIISTSSENFSSDYDFDANQLEYNVVLPVGTSISSYDFDYKRGDVYQSVEAVMNDGVYTVVVTAEDGVHTKTYTVNVSVKKSDYAYLSDIIINGLSLETFVAETLSYTIDLPAGTVTMPNVSYTAGDQWQTIEYVKSDDGKVHTITVTSHSGVVSVYTITFNVLKSDNAQLSGIRVIHDDSSLKLSPDFDGSNNEYYLALPYVYKENLPQFVPISVSGQTLTDEHQPTSYDDAYSVTVVAEDGVTTLTYTVQLNLQPSENAYLTMIYVDGEQINNFAETTFSYEKSLVYTTTSCPAITYDLAEPDNQTADLAISEINNGWQAVITVTAASGDTEEYYVEMEIEDSPENRLSSLLSFGTEVEDFDPDVTEYSVVYPPYTETSVLPTVNDITYVLMDASASAVVSQTDENTIVIQVTAENGDVRNYILETTIEISDNTDLEGLYIDSVLVEGFDASVIEYYYTLDFGATYVDETRVSFKLSESGQTAIVYKDGMDVKVLVTAQDGTTATYVIHFVASTFDPTADVMADGLCITRTDDGYWKFTSKYSNVYVLLADLSGRPLLRAEIPMLDPNLEDACDSRGEGYLYVPQYSGVHVYVFTAKNKVILGGKFRAKE